MLFAKLDMFLLPAVVYTVCEIACNSSAPLVPSWVGKGLGLSLADSLSATHKKRAASTENGLS